MKLHRTPRTNQRGFTILLAALVASLVLSLGISVFAIAQKQLILASTGRNSQYAFYAADTAAECALYWDLRHNFASTSNPVSPITCDDDTGITVSHTDLLTYPIFFEFEFEPNGYCARVTVRKNTVHPRTLIRADGFSEPCAQVETSARTLQRSVELTY
ncbi:MAG TPA: hypothetical protein VNM40_01925 [Candidatus Paceibacterota bacterium]|nr:hypothetical protein [Candidatus Paceibacterota bacterium]